MTDLGFKEENIDNLIYEIINALPYTALILNPSREIIYANKVSTISNKDFIINNFIGKRVGEVINCLNFSNSIEACGETPNCKFCGTTDVISKSQLSKQSQSQESRVTRIINNNEYSFEFQVTASPLVLNQNDYILLTMLDISDQARKRALERIFFHDVLNKTGSLSGFFQLIKLNNDPEKQAELLEIAETISNDLNEDINSQREIMAAENGELIVEKTEGNSQTIIESIANQLSIHNLFKNHKITISHKNADVNFDTDIVLLKRILVNMLKNAIEASEPDDRIEIGSILKKNTLRFFVYNAKSIPYAIQLQIFQRSFSTKGYDRGLGTYSMKLLGERYLHGKVHFVSNELEGTTFYFDLPIEN